MAGVHHVAAHLLVTASVAVMMVAMYTRSNGTCTHSTTYYEYF